MGEKVQILQDYDKRRKMVLMYFKCPIEIADQIEKLCFIRDMKLRKIGHNYSWTDAKYFVEPSPEW